MTGGAAAFSQHVTHQPFAMKGFAMSQDSAYLAALHQERADAASRGRSEKVEEIDAEIGRFETNPRAAAAEARKAAAPAKPHRVRTRRPRTT